MKKLLLNTSFVLFIAAVSLTSCSYTAEDYFKDMSELTEETIKNATSYTEEDWKEVGEKYRKINERGKGVLEDLTEEQKKEMKKLSRELNKKAAEFNRDEIEEQFEDLLDKADDFIDNLKDSLED